VGREYRLKGKPELVRTHDFPDEKLGKAIPYGVYDLASDEGWVNVGIDHDTAQFAVASIRSWWEHLGHGRYPDASCLTITADCGGSNGRSIRLRRIERPPPPALEGRAAKARRRDRPFDQSLPLPAGHLEMEESRRGGSHSPALADPGVSLSTHRAPIVQPSGRTPKRQ